MLDPYLRPLIDPPLNTLGRYLARVGVSANRMTLLAFLFGVAAIFLIMAHRYSAAMVFILLNRLADGLDGAIARNTAMTDLGGFLDIVGDFIIYSGIVLAFGLANPQNLPYAAILLFSFIGPIASFLAYAIIATKRQTTTENRGKKSFFYLGGICEGTETAAVLVLFCLAPPYFDVLAIGYAVLCWITTAQRVYFAHRDFGAVRTDTNSQIL